MLTQLFLTLLALLLLNSSALASGKTVYVHLLDGDDTRGDGSYSHPFKSWRTALRHVESGDTVIAKNGDYRKAGRDAKWGGLDLVWTMSERNEADPSRQVPKS